MDNKPIRILLIEDNAGDARLIQEQLKEVPEITYILQRVSQLQEGLTYLNQNEMDVILSDLSLPDSPGLETFKRLQTETPKLPVVVVTGFDNESAALAAVREGAQDYLIKGQVDSRGLSRTILYAIERHRTQATLRNLSLTDELTGLYNRRGFVTLGEQALKSALRAKSHLYLYYADLDGLKKINDGFGHPDGDHAISAAAEVLKKTFRGSDIVARMGGDEFAILAAEDQNKGSDVIMTRLHSNLAHYNLQNPRPYKVSLSVGVAKFNPKAPVSIEELLSQSDKVLYVSKGKKHSALSKVPVRKIFASLVTGLLLWGLGKSIKIHKHPSPVVPLQPQPAAMIAPPLAVAERAPMKKTPHVQDTSEPPISISQTPASSPLVLHRELLPENITFTRFSYQETIVSPGTQFSFRIVGSGFTPDLQKTLTVYAGSPHVQVVNLHLATVNELRGDMIVQPQAPTQYLFPTVLINQNPVFQAANPFAIIAPGEVLDIVFINTDDKGQAGRFRIYTNLDTNQARQFHVIPGDAGMTISPLDFKLLPYRVEGVLHINDAVSHGDYSLSAFLGAKEVFRKDQLIQVTRPMIGSTGFIQSVTAQEAFRRPGDTVHITVQGNGFTAGLAALLKMRVEGLDRVESLFHYLSPSRLEGSLTIPKGAPEKAYYVTISQGHDVVYRGKDVFRIVPMNWIDGLDVSPPARPGQKSLLKILGRDFSGEFVKMLQIETDEPGIRMHPPVQVDASTLKLEMDVDHAVTPGDYMINIKSNGVPIKPQGGNLITISARERGNGDE